MAIGLFSVYMLKAAIYLLLFYAFNKLFLSKDTFHALNRCVWLLSIVAAFALPAYVVDVQLNEVVAASSNSVEGVNLDAFNSVEELSLFGVDSVVKALFYIYILGVVLLFVCKVVIYCKLIYFIFRYRVGAVGVEQSYNKDYPELSKSLSLLDSCKKRLGIKREIKFIIHNADLAPFSWLNYIVVSNRDINEGGENILLHELAHIKFLHSLDIIFLDLVSIVMWFNPAIWLIKRELQQVHEYSADNVVLKSGADCKEYQLLLIKKAVGDSYYSVANSFNHSNLKKRISMMLKKRSSKWGMVKGLYALPMVLFVVNLYATPKLSSNLGEISAVVIDTLVSNSVNETISADNAIKVIGYPQSDDGKSPLLVIDGKEYKNMTILKEIPANNIKSITVLKGESAIKVYGKEKSENGVILITLKNKKELAEEAANATPDSAKNLIVKSATTDTAKFIVNGVIKDSATNVVIKGINSKGTPLVIVDGKEYKGSVDDISPNKIANITVLKDESAIKVYGKEKGANGVIVITLKK